MERRRGPEAPRAAATPTLARGTVPLLTRWEAAGSARAVSAAGLRGQEAPPHRGRVGRGRPTPHVRSPPPSPPASSAAETCAEPGPRRHRREGGLANGCSKTGGEHKGQIRRNCGGGGGCHGQTCWAEARAGEAAAPRGRLLGSQLTSGSAAPGEVAAAASLCPLRPRSRSPSWAGGGAWRGRGLGRLHKACAARGGDCGQVAEGTLTSFCSASGG